MTKKFFLFISIILCAAFQLSAQSKPQIDRSRFEISTQSTSFPAGGGTKSLTVTADNDWNISARPESWATATKSGKKIILKVKANTSSSARSTSFSISSIGKKITVKISQSGAPVEEKPATPVISKPSKKSESSTLYISSTYAEFGPDGGSKSFSVSSNKAWEISTNTASWGRLTRSGNYLTLNVKANTSSQSRTDYFVLKSGQKTVRVNISQSAAIFKISDNSANFTSTGGSRTFTVTSNKDWQISSRPMSWCNITRSGNQLTVRADANHSLNSRSTSFSIKSGEKTLSVFVEQSGESLYLSVNGSSTSTSVNFGSYGSSRDITINTNADNYEIWGLPSWCRVTNRTRSGFSIVCSKNNDSYSRSDYLEVRAKGKKVKVNISQNADYGKYKRRVNGGWVNMAIGLEGGYNVGGEDSWTANGVVGVRFGNFSDIVQFELGVAPGVISTYDRSPTFHMPVYGSLKLSTTSGKFYLKLGGAYNAVKDSEYEGDYSLRAGFGSAWKHFEWDWAYVQFNAPPDYVESSSFSDMFNKSNIFIGMRMAWYITR